MWWDHIFDGGGQDPENRRRNKQIPSANTWNSDNRMGVANESMEKGHVFRMVDACVATLFESHPLWDLVRIEDYLQFAWCSLSRYSQEGFV